MYILMAILFNIVVLFVVAVVVVAFYTLEQQQQQRWLFKYIENFNEHKSYTDILCRKTDVKWKELEKKEEKKKCERKQSTNTHSAER